MKTCTKLCVVNKIRSKIQCTWTIVIICQSIFTIHKHTKCIQNESQNRMEMVFTYDQIRCFYLDSRFRFADFWRFFNYLWTESEHQLKQCVCEFLEKGNYMGKSKVPNIREQITSFSLSFCHSFAFDHSLFLFHTHNIILSMWLWVCFCCSIRYRSVYVILHVLVRGCISVSFMSRQELIE